MAEKSRRTTTHREAVRKVQHAKAFTVDVPILGKIEVPRPDQLAFYGGIAVLVALEIIEWPVALVVTAGHLLVNQHHNKMLEELGEVIETAEG